MTWWPVEWLRWDDSEELYNLDTDPEEWRNLASDEGLTDIKNQLAGYIPANPIDLPEISLIELMEHHVPPFRSREYFFSEERQEWIKRFD